MGFHMRPQTRTWVKVGHCYEIVLERVGLNNEGRGREVVNVHVPTERLELSLAAS